MKVHGGREMQLIGVVGICMCGRNAGHIRGRGMQVLVYGWGMQGERVNAGDVKMADAGVGVGEGVAGQGFV
jgi:hypothetical protein